MAAIIFIYFIIVLYIDTAHKRNAKTTIQEQFRMVTIGEDTFLYI